MFSHRDLAGLNDREMQVYPFIIKQREGVSYMTIRELAEQTGLSTTTVLRFCRKRVATADQCSTSACA